MYTIANMKKKRLYRHRSDKMIAGVLAGMADYFDQDPTLWRIMYIVLALVTALGPAIVIYIIAWMVMPEAPEDGVYEAEYTVHYK